MGNCDNEPIFEQIVLVTIWYPLIAGFMVWVRLVLNESLGVTR